MQFLGKIGKVLEDLDDQPAEAGVTGSQGASSDAAADAAVEVAAEAGLGRGLLSGGQSLLGRGVGLFANSGAGGAEPGTAASAEEALDAEGTATGPGMGFLGRGVGLLSTAAGGVRGTISDLLADENSDGGGGDSGSSLEGRLAAWAQLDAAPVAHLAEDDAEATKAGGNTSETKGPANADIDSAKASSASLPDARTTFKDHPEAAESLETKLARSETERLRTQQEHEQTLSRLEALRAEMAVAESNMARNVALGDHETNAEARVMELEQALADAEAERGALQKKVSQLEALQADRDSAGEQKAAQDSKQDELQDKLNASEEEKHMLEKSLATAQSETTRIEKQQEGLRSELCNKIECLQQELAVAQREKSEQETLYRAAADAEAELSTLKQGFARLEAERESLQERMAQLDAVREAGSDAEAQRFELQAQLAAAQEGIADAESAKQRATQEHEHELSELQEHLQSTRAALSLAEKEKAETEALAVAASETERQLAQLNQSLAAVGAERDSLRDQVAQLRRDHEAASDAEARLAELEGKLSASKENVQRLEASLAHAESEKQSTIHEHKQAQSDLTEQLESARAMLVGFEGERGEKEALANAAANVEAELATLKETVLELESERAGLQEAVRQLEEQQQLDAESDAASASQHTEVQAKLDKSSEEIRRLETALAGAEAQAVRTKTQHEEVRSELSKQLETAHAALAAANDEKAEGEALTSTASEMESQLERLRQALADSESKRETLQESISRLEAQHEANSGSIAQLEIRLADECAEKNRVNEAHALAAKQLEDARSASVDVAGHNTALVSAAADTEARLSQLTQTLSEVEHERDDLKSMIAELKAQSEAPADAEGASAAQRVEVETQIEASKEAARKLEASLAEAQCERERIEKTHEEHRSDLSAQLESLRESLALAEAGNSEKEALATTALEGMEAQLSHLRPMVDELEHERQQLKERVGQLEAQHEADAVSDAASCTKRIDLEAKLLASQEAIAQLEENIVQLRSEKALVERKHAETCSQHSEQVESLRAAMDSAKGDTSESDALRGSLLQHQAQLTVLQQSLLEAEAERASLRDRASEFEAQHQRSTHSEEAAVALGIDLQAKLRTSEEAIDELERRLDETQSEAKIVERKHEDARRDLHGELESLRSALATAEGAKSERDALATANTKAEARLAELENAHAASHADRERLRAQLEAQQEVGADAEAASAAQRIELEAKLSASHRELQRLEARLADLESQRRESSAAGAESAGREADLQAKLLAAEQELSRLEACDAEAAQLRRRISVLEDDQKALQDRIAQAEAKEHPGADGEPTSVQLTELKMQLLQAQSEANMMRDSYKEDQRLITELREQLEKMQHKLSLRDDAPREENAQDGLAHDTIVELQQQLEKVEARERRQGEELSRLRAQLEEWEKPREQAAAKAKAVQSGVLDLEACATKEEIAGLATVDRQLGTLAQNILGTTSKRRLLFAYLALVHFWMVASSLVHGHYHL